MVEQKGCRSGWVAYVFISIHDGQKTHQHLHTSGFCLSCECVKMAFTSASNYSVVTSVYQLQLWSVVEEIRPKWIHSFRTAHVQPPTQVRKEVRCLTPWQLCWNMMCQISNVTDYDSIIFWMLSGELISWRWECSWTPIFSRFTRV